MNVDADRLSYPVVLVLAVVVVLLPLFVGEFAFFLDSIVGPTWPSPVRELYGLSKPTYGGRFPLMAILVAVSFVVGTAILQKLFLGSTLAILAFLPYRTLPGTQYQRLYAALLFLLNPFTYARLLVGHWLVLWGLAMLPLLLYTFTRYFEEGGYTNLLLVVASLTLLGFNAHLLFASTILIGFLLTFRYAETRDTKILSRAAVIPAVAVPVNAYWLAPVLLSGSSSLSTVGTSGIPTFAPEGNVINALYSVASMHGFWRSGYVYAKDIAPITAVLFVPILLLAVYGFVTHHDDPDHGYVVRALGATWLVRSEAHGTPVT